MEKKELLYEGKAKRLFATGTPDVLVQEFKDDATAFDGAKKGTISNKGGYNCQISTLMFEHLNSFHVPTHFISQLNENEMLVKKVEIIPIEAVMRNIATGSLVKRLPFEDGKALPYPIFEMYLKNDSLGDPLINEYHAFALELCKPEEVRAIYRMTAKVNAIIRSLFERRGMLLVDFKLEFGRFNNELILADEVSPDTCRIWDKKTNKKLDKDRFRHDMGNVEDAYKEVLDRLQNV